MTTATTTVVRITASCAGCGACVTTCPTRAILREPRRLVVEARRCTSCLACIEVCPAGAIEEGASP